MNQPMYRHFRTELLGLALALSVIVCSCAPSPDIYPAGTTVTLTIREISPTPFQLGPRSSKLFLDMLTNQPVHSQISQMPAYPLGRFTVGSNLYLWHGNGVIRGKDRHERLWHGAFVQRLVRERMSWGTNAPEEMLKILDKLEADPSVADTRIDGPGQYPGGANDALHPSERP